MDYQGTISRGVRAPIIRQGDDLVTIACDCVINASKTGGWPIQDHDVYCITEAVLGRAQGNYATIDQIAKDVNSIFGDETVGLVFPIFSRNRFSQVLAGIAKGVKKLIVQLSYPSDEVGNSFVTYEKMMEKGVNPYTDVF
ncbi:MAG: coenzyme F420-0:L-glutamate ligase, partial [Clostridia bacterium]|nr:coenzyme F420-0:L-glutamate ligase [Clostridia bacterium]